jgi:hypothetical protein
MSDNSSTEEYQDRSCCGDVLVVLHTCMPYIIVCKIDKYDGTTRNVSININEVELMEITEEYAQLLVGEKGNEKIAAARALCSSNKGESD